MKGKIQLVRKRFKKLAVIMLCSALVFSWFQMPEIASAATNVFPESVGARTTSGDVPGYVEEEEEEEEEIGEEDVSEPEKKSGHISVLIEDYYYGGTPCVPQLYSETGDVKDVILTYKVTGADDSTYTGIMPTEVGNYTVLAVLPSDSKYKTAVATDTFNIRYLSTPNPAYVLEGTPGDNGWYKSEVSLRAPEGYEMSVGDRNHFMTEAYMVEEETANLRIYLRKLSTGEQTDGITIANLRIDADAPVLHEMQDGDEIYADILNVNFSEEHFETAKVDGKEAEVMQKEDGTYTFAVETGMKRLTHTIVLADEAGNETTVSLIIGPAWLEDGIVGDGSFYLETGVEYHLPAGDDWTMEGDDTVYVGGNGFYAGREGEVTFHKE